MDAIDSIFGSEEEISDPKLQLQVREWQIINAVVDDLPELLSRVGISTILSPDPDKRLKSAGLLSRRISKVILRAVDGRSDRPRGPKPKHRIRDLRIYRLRNDKKKHLSWGQIATIMRMDKYNVQSAFRRYVAQLRKNPYKLIQDTLEERFPSGS
jgi:hypothetical protein